MRLGPAGLAPALIAVAVALAPAGPVRAQSYARFAGADSALAPALRAAGAGFEGAWNDLLVSELRARLARADSAARLLDLARGIAAAEPGALGSRIAADALALRDGWSPLQRRVRIRAAATESLAALARGRRDFDRTDSLFHAALADYRRLGERRREAWVLGSLGVNAFIAGRYPRAESLYREALTARLAIGDEAMIGNTLNALGSTHYLLGRYSDAYDYFQQARAVRERTGEGAALGATLNYLGLAAEALGRPDSARVWFARALELTVTGGDSVRTAEVLVNTARLLGSQDRVGQALPLYERALGIARAAGDVRTQAVVQQNVAELLRGQGRHSEAVARLEDAASLRLRLRDMRGLIFTSIGLGRAWLGLSDPQRARPPLERALGLADSLGDRTMKARALNNLALVARQEGDATGAQHAAEQSLAAADSASDSLAVHEALVTLGELAHDRGDLTAADAWFARAAATSSGLGAGGGAIGQASLAEVQALDEINLGVVRRERGQGDAAAEHFRRALAVAEAGHNDDIVWPALLGLGDVAEHGEDPVAALAWYRRAAAMIDTLRARQGEEGASITLFSRRLFAYEALIALLGRLDPQYPDSGFAAEAFAWSERARARAFLDLVAASGRETVPPRPLTLIQAQGLLGERDALIEYSLGDSSSSMWVVTRGAWRRFTLPPRPGLKTRAELLRRGLADPRRAEARGTRAAAHALYQALIEPAAPMLRRVDHLIVAPDGVLALIPFEALLAEEPAEGRPPKRGAYLLERYQISYAPSATALAAHRIGGDGRGVMAVGNPAFASASDSAVAGPLLPPLPATATELESLERLAGSRPLSVLAGAEATRARVLADPALGTAGVIHIATHGEANETEPARSGLWLAAAAGGGGPGFLSVGDILGLDLHAGLVTLSACETGLGRLERGEGVLGLTRAFMAAGAQSVVVSLWKVNDRSTARLMERFYRGLLPGRDSRARALADAKRALLADSETRSPFYWAPFILVGEAGPLR
ncbi:MAG: hypothetical protein A2W00_01515 [Candidatus Eisenbacteria bacterium RBG_16_71_46]|nr:MAG: hypothetical protein A2W00_01515 [Candidatus Eisenbacteria bacterium RBG_16_71_46]